MHVINSLLSLCVIKILYISIVEKYIKFKTIIAQICMFIDNEIWENCMQHSYNDVI